MLTIRPYHPSDLAALYRICLLTGDNGADASTMFDDPDLIGNLYAAPYAVLEPDLCFVLSKDGEPVGYVLGTADSERFRHRTEQEWFGPLRERYPLPPGEDDSRQAHMARNIHEGYQPVPNMDDYPAHLHIDLLPVAQGQGWGPKMIQRFLETLREKGVSGVHLGVGKGNARALAFYQKLGFRELLDGGNWAVYGLRL